jgi:hypothetical protein
MLAGRHAAKAQEVPLMSHTPRGLAALGLSIGLLGLAPSPALAQPSPPIVHEGVLASGCSLVVPGIGSQVLVLLGAVPVGRTIVITAQATNSSVIPGIVIDATGINLYTSDVSFTGTGIPVSVYSSRITSPLLLGQIITIPYNNTSGLIHTVCASASAFSGVRTTAGFVDQTGTGGSATTTTSLAMSTAGATTQPNDLLAGGFATSNPGTFTLAAGLTAIAPACNVGNNVCLFPFYRVLAGAPPAVQTATATTTSPVPWGGALVAYRGEDFPVELQSFGIE